MEEKFAKGAYWNFLFWGVCSSLGITVSTIVDAVLVGNFIGSDGLAVANLATPVFLTYALFGLTIGTGANVLIGRSLGADQVEAANRSFHAQLCAGLAVGLVCAVLCVVGRDGLFRFLGATEELLPLVRDYLTAAFFSAPVFVLYHIFSISVRTDGAPRLAAAAAAVVIVTNLALDLLFMGAFSWGIVGASLSLCIAEVLGLAVLLLHFLDRHALLRLRLALPRRDELRSFLSNGFGIGSVQIFQAAVMLVFNTLLLAGPDGVAHVAVFGVLYTMSTIPLAVFDGAGSALTTVVSIFTGERDTDSIHTVLGLGMRIVLLAGALLAAAFLLLAEPIVSLFGLGGGAVFPTAVGAFRLYAASLLFMGVNALAVSFWQTVGRTRLAGAASILRSFALPLLLGVFLIPRLHINGLSLTYVLGEVLCLAGVLLVYRLRGSRAYLAEKYPPGDRVFERYYLIRTESISQLSDDLAQVCDDWDIGPSQAFFINLISEELILNIIKFGLKDPGQTRYIAIRLLERQGEYILRIRDNVNTYNPFEPGETSGGDAIDTAIIDMIRTKSKHCDYQRKLIFNYLYLVL